jgi:hypothetical protein
MISIHRSSLTETILFSLPRRLPESGAVDTQSCLADGTAADNAGYPLV